MPKFLSYFYAALFLSLPAIAVAQTTAAAPQMSDHAAARFLDQATWGPTPASIAQLQQMGIQNWLTVQFAATPSEIPDQPLLASDGKTNRNLAPVQASFFQNAVTGPDQLRQRVAFALSEIWVVSAITTNVAYAFPPYWRIFRDNAFGNYRDIIQAVTLSPAMGNYLNMANNNKGNAAKGTAANENYARELMQLFTLGLTQLNLNGRAVVDKNLNSIATYTQSDVTNIARMLTGWTYPTAPGATAKNNNPAYYFGQMIPVEAEHDTTSKTIFNNIQIPAGLSASQDLTALIDNLMQQQTMAPFICQQLMQHLVTSNPSGAYIQRVAQVFQNDGSGVQGDMKAVITAILTDPEARAADDPTVAAPADFGHMREPVLFMANILRGLNATLGTGAATAAEATNLGQELFYAPSVFSYFSPQARANGLVAPEFQIYSTQTAANRVDTINSAIYGILDKGTQLNLTPFEQKADTLPDLIDYISYVFFHHTMSQSLQSAIKEAAGAVTTPLAQTQAALYIALTSGEYQIIQ